MKGSHRIQTLLDELCVELGFCLSPDEQEASLAASAGDIDRFVERVFIAAGIEPDRSSSLYAQARDQVASVFESVIFMTVAWPDGSTIAEVDVNATSDPIALGHVLGTFRCGPGFARLVPYLEEVRSLHEAGDLEGAFRASKLMDGLDILAVDELGRRYDVYNLVFAEGGLLFAVAPKVTMHQTPSIAAR